MSTLSVGTIKSTDSNPPVIQNSSGVEIGELCRAWVNFNGTGTVAIRAQFNVSSITDNGTGNYSVNFTAAMPDSNYGVSFGANQAVNGTDTKKFVAGVGTATTSTVVVYTGSGASTSLEDSAVVCATVFR